MSTPSIVPNDRLDKDLCLVLEDFRSSPAFRETEEGIDYTTLLNGLLSGEYGQVVRVVAMNPAEGWSRDASEDVAHALELRVATGHYEISEELRDFIEGQTGRRIGQQFSLL